MERTLVVAEEQKAGRGRQSRAWLSPLGSLNLSFILRSATAQLPYMVMVARVMATGRQCFPPRSSGVVSSP